MLAAASFGLENIVCMGGDPPGAGDHPDAKPVFDLDTLALLKAARSMNQGTDMMGKALKGSPHYTIGAVANPGAPDLEKEIARMGDKVRDGAEFFQTQAVYEPEVFARFMDQAKQFGKPVIAGFIILKSGNMARRLNETLPGVSVPEALIKEMDAAEDKSAKIDRDRRPHHLGYQGNGPGRARDGHRLGIAYSRDARGRWHLKARIVRWLLHASFRVPSKCTGAVAISSKRHPSPASITSPQSSSSPIWKARPRVVTAFAFAATATAANFSARHSWSARKRLRAYAGR